MKKLLLVAVFGSLAFTAACSNMRNGGGSLVSNVFNSKGEGGTFVEGYIDYPGPDAKWVGPRSLTIHIKAWDPTGPAQTVAYPVLFDELTPKVPPSTHEANVKKGKREISSMTTHTTATTAPTLLTAQDAREHLAELGKSMETRPGKPIPGCLSPVRVRLIRADGAVYEKQGCRGQQGWTDDASQAANYFISAGISSAGTMAYNPPNSSANHMADAAPTAMTPSVPAAATQTKTPTTPGVTTPTTTTSNAASGTNALGNHTTGVGAGTAAVKK